jgi:hypothetical protein
MTTRDVATATGRHRETVTQALRDGSLHGTQSKKKGTWLTEEGCVEAWVYHRQCSHVTKLSRVA